MLFFFVFYIFNYLYQKKLNYTIILFYIQVLINKIKFSFYTRRETRIVFSTSNSLSIKVNKI